MGSQSWTGLSDRTRHISQKKSQLNNLSFHLNKGLPGSSWVKKLRAVQETPDIWFQFLGGEEPLELWFSSKYMPNGYRGSSDGKESACNARGPGPVPGSERSPGQGDGNPLQYSFLENPHDRRAWWVTVGYSPWGCKELDMTDDYTFTFFHMPKRGSPGSVSQTQKDKHHIILLICRI